ncbi:PH domain-containing protein [Corynebacterium halotolerans]|uniref:PH domain-containing protein n=1 Tax=Corynebacterium halotolerans TaxID=225326 RepID=UPI003CFAA87B
MSSKAGHQAETARETHTFRPERTHVLAAFVITLILLLMIGHNPPYLVWLLLFPIAFVYWVFTARTTVGEDGIDIRYAFRGRRHIAWDDVAGVAFKRARALLSTTSGQEHTLPGVTFNSLPHLQEASRGRIPDVLTAGRIAADDKVVVYDRDGEPTLISKEEHARREAEKARRQAAAESAEQTETGTADTPDTDPRS